MDVNYQSVLKVASLPLALFLLIPFADVHYWQQMPMPMPEFLCMYWLRHPAFTLRCLPLYAIPELLEIIFLVRWAVRPCLRTGTWLAIGTFFTLGAPLYLFVMVGGFLFR